MHFGVTVDEIFETMEQRFRPQGAEGVDAVLAYDITGEGGGRWLVTVRDKRVRVERVQELEGYTAKITADARTFVGVNTGDIDGGTAFGSGRIRVDGDMGLIITSMRLFKKVTSLKEGVERPQELVVIKRVISLNMEFSTGPVMGRFFEGLKERRILANRCPQCGRLQLPPREVCAECRCWAGEFVEVGQEGRLLMNDITYYASPDPLTGQTREAPYGTIHVLLDGCRDNETFWHMLKREDLFRVRIGDRVRAVWAEERRGSIFDIQHFEMV